MNALMKIIAALMVVLLVMSAIGWVKNEVEAFFEEVNDSIEQMFDEINVQP